MASILVVDDDPEALGSICRTLEADGHTMMVASGGQAALELMARQRPDVAIIDILMPEMDGYELCRRIRADPFLLKLPIIFLTAKSRPHDIAEGLDVGADDYLTKPFQVIELPARVRAALRRSPGSALDPSSDFLTIGDLRLHTNHPKVYVKDLCIELTGIEHRLLCYLMLHAGRPVSAEQLLEDVWEYPPHVGNPDLVYMHMTNLRAKFKAHTGKTQYVRNVRGRGYMIEVQDNL